MPDVKSVKSFDVNSGANSILTGAVEPSVLLNSSSTFRNLRGLSGIVQLTNALDSFMSEVSTSLGSGTIIQTKIRKENEESLYH